MSATLETPPEFNRTGVNYSKPMPHPPIRGAVIDGHVHLTARRHAADWFAAADHFGIEYFVSQSPLEEALILQREWGHRIRFVAVPAWQRLAETGAIDDWLRRIEAFYNLGARMAKIHVAPGTMKRTRLRLDQPGVGRILSEIRDRGMIIMTHVGDPQIWYDGKYKTDADADNSLAFLADRDAQYQLWEERLDAFRGTPWLGAHLGGNPEDLPRVQTLLDRFPDLVLDLSATKWMVREIGRRRDDVRDFIIRNQTRIIWGSDQVSQDARGWDFYASRWWCHRKLFETAYNDTTPIHDPDLPDDQQPRLRGLALPDGILQKLYRDNVVRFMAQAGVKFD
jgi:hypothetical protein